MVLSTNHGIHVDIVTLDQVSLHVRHQNLQKKLIKAFKLTSHVARRNSNVLFILCLLSY